MELTPTLVNAFVVAAVGAVLSLMVTGFSREFREEMRSLRTEFTGDIAELRAELREEICGDRSDLTRVALAVGAMPRAQRE